MKFDDVNLNNDKSAPKIDLDLGGFGGATNNEKKPGGGFSFGGGWGGGWGSTANSWGFGGLDDKKDTNKVVDDSGWNFSSSGKKDEKKKKNNGGFDFDFDNLAEENVDLGAAAKEEKPEDDPW